MYIRPSFSKNIKLITVRNYKNVDTNKLQHDLENSPWQLIDLFDDPDDSLWCWETMFINALVNHAKARKVKVRSENQPWMTGTLRKSINNRFKLFNTAKLSANDPEIWKIYKKSRNYCTNAICKAKAEHLSLIHI